MLKEQCRCSFVDICLDISLSFVLEQCLISLSLSWISLVVYCLAEHHYIYIIHVATIISHPLHDVCKSTKATHFILSLMNMNKAKFDFNIVLMHLRLKDKRIHTVSTVVARSFLTSLNKQEVLRRTSASHCMPCLGQKNLYYWQTITFYFL